MTTGRNKTPLVGWHPSAGLVAWLDSEVERRGGGRGVRSAILEEALAAYKQAMEPGNPQQRRVNAAISAEVAREAGEVTTAKPCTHRNLRMAKGVCPDCQVYVASKQ